MFLHPIFVALFDPSLGWNDKGNYLFFVHTTYRKSWLFGDLFKVLELTFLQVQKLKEVYPSFFLLVLQVNTFKLYLISYTHIFRLYTENSQTLFDTSIQSRVNTLIFWLFILKGKLCKVCIFLQPTYRKSIYYKLCKRWTHINQYMWSKCSNMLCFVAISDSMA